jgi:uncharacterized MAPEG superfamily protein
MTTELTMLALAVVLGLVQIVLAAAATTAQTGLPWAAGPRDDAMPSTTAICGRLRRALSNFMETFPLFAAAVLIAHAVGHHDWMTVWAHNSISGPASSMCRFTRSVCSWHARWLGPWRPPALS